MITQVKNFRQVMEFESNFEQDVNSTTGTSFAYFAGSVQKAGALVEISASTVTVPTGTSTVYVDIEPGSPSIKADLVITSAKFVPLYTVISDGFNITSVVDMKSFTSASQDIGQ